jgi:hypothetical protein
MMELVEFIKNNKDIAELVIFAWFVLNNNNGWRKYLSERNSKMEKALALIAEKMTTCRPGTTQQPPQDP